VNLSSHKGTLIALAIIGGVLIWNYNREPDHLPQQDTQRPRPTVSTSPPPSTGETSPPYTSEVLNPPVRPVPGVPDVIPPAPATTSPSAARVLPGSVSDIPTAAVDISEDLSAVDAAIRNFQAALGENPIGSNAEITGALLGNNLKQIKLEVPAGSTVNGEGEMCDRWGTPYFFHQVSKTEMEIRSAGPDRRMWTGDDAQM
jgi:hypothetical protein